MKTNLKLLIFLSFVISFSFSYVNGQDNKERIGQDEIIKTGSNYYNYADKDKINFEVSVWGYVKSPGKYLIPKGTTFIDLISLCGGPLIEADLEDIRIVRLKNDTLGIKDDSIINLNYNDFLWEKKISNSRKNNPSLYPGDVILLPGSPKYFFKDNLGIILSAVTTLTSIAVLMITIFKK